MDKCPACGNSHVTRGKYETTLLKNARHFECEDCGFLICAITDEVINMVLFPSSKVSLTEEGMVECRKTGMDYTIYVKPNGIGGRTYWSDEIGGGVMIWDTSLVHVATLVEAIAAEFAIEIKEFAERHGGKKIPRKNL